MARTSKLSDEFNSFWRNALNTKENLYSKMSITDFVNLKKALSNINNIITLEVTKHFVNFLQRNGIITYEQENAMLEEVDSINANTNGYDIEFPLKKDAETNIFADSYAKILAEVKCCIPVNKNSYGAAQEESILDDIAYLHNGKKKSKLEEEERSQYFKFLVLLNTECVPDSAEKIIIKAQKNYKIKLFEPSEILDTQYVYVVVLNP